MTSALGALEAWGAASWKSVVLMLLELFPQGNQMQVRASLCTDHTTATDAPRLCVDDACFAMCG
jgi:hypothetical protein